MIFDEFRAEIEETVDCGSHMVCAAGWVGRGSVKIVRATLTYPDRATAIEAAGLSDCAVEAPGDPGARPPSAFTLHRHSHAVPSMEQAAAEQVAALIRGA